MKEYGLVLSNDVKDPEQMLRVTEQSKEFIDGVKIGITSSMLPGVEVFKRVKDILGDDVALLADYKVADIGFTNKKSGDWEGTNQKIVETLSNAGADYITCHTITGIASIEESVSTAHANGAKVLTLPYMTHKGANLFFGMPLGEVQRQHMINEFEAYGLKKEENEQLYGMVNKANTVTDLILMLGNHFNVDGYIGPGNNPDVIKNYRSFTQDEVWSPGFGRQDKKGRNLDEQIAEWAPLVGPKSAMIVGSLIYKADDPNQAAREVMETRDKVVSNL